MIRLILQHLEQAYAESGLPWRQLCADLPYSTCMRWKSRSKLAQPLLEKPGPKKSQPLDWEGLYGEVVRLPHGRQRTAGTTGLHARWQDSISRRQLQRVTAEIRRTKLDLMKHIQWHLPGLAWSIDATEYGTEGWKLIPMQDLCSRYRFVPLLSTREDGRQIARHLERTFRQHGAPLFLKRDNGSPFNNQHIDEVLDRYGVLPLNSPPRYPRYNGAMEKSIRDLKTSLEKRLTPGPEVPPDMLSHLEATIHELNHKPRRCLKRRTACQAFHSPKGRFRLRRPVRQKILRLIYSQYARTIAEIRGSESTHHKLAAAWRRTVEARLFRHGLISVQEKQKQKPNVSTNFLKNWSHN